MNKIIIPVIASILILGTLGLTDAFAGNHGNNGNNGCEKSGNAKACENNPNTTPNTPPSIGSISIFLIDPIFPGPIDVTGIGTGQAGPFKCIANDVTDVDGDTVTFTYSWTNPIGDVLGTEQILPFGLAVDRGYTTCEVIPFDGTDSGDPESASFYRSCPPDCGI